jgi:Protein of unknown function (DUF1579)
MRRFLTTTVVLGLIAAAPLTAQQQPEVKAGPEHAKLKEAVGTWDATIKEKGGDAKGVMKMEMGLNDLWLLEHFTADIGGKKFEGHGATSYDPATKKYVGVWIDSMSTRPMVTEGTYDSSKKTMTMHGNMMHGDKSMKCTLTTVMKDADTKEFTIRGDMDGKDLEMVHIVYKRRK